MKVRTCSALEYRQEKRTLKSMIQRKKRSCWAKFLEQEGQGRNNSVLRIARIAKDPFAIRPRMGTLTTDKGTEARTDEEKITEFQKHHPIPHEKHEHPRPVPSSAYIKADPSQVKRALHVLSKTSNHSAPGPDRIPYRLIKLIKDTPLGHALINDIALTSGSGFIPPRFFFFFWSLYA